MITNSVKWEALQVIDAIEAARRNLDIARAARYALEECFHSADMDLAVGEDVHKRMGWLLKVLEDEEKLAALELDRALKIMGQEPEEEE